MILKADKPKVQKYYLLSKLIFFVVIELGTQANAAAAKSETKHLNERNSDKNAFYRIDNVQREFSEDSNILLC